MASVDSELLSNSVSAVIHINTLCYDG